MVGKRQNKSEDSDGPSPPKTPKTRGRPRRSEQPVVKLPKKLLISTPKKTPKKNESPPETGPDRASRSLRSDTKVNVLEANTPSPVLLKRPTRTTRISSVKTPENTLPKPSSTKETVEEASSPALPKRLSTRITKLQTPKKVMPQKSKTTVNNRPTRNSTKPMQNGSTDESFDETKNLRSQSQTPKTPSKAKINGAPSEIRSPLLSPGKAGGGWRFNSLGVPQCPLPCRESQFEEIWTFLNDNISQKNSRCMYVSGVPGTGKTVIVQSVVDTLWKYASERKKHLEFKHVYINGLSLASPDKIWKRFLNGLQGKKDKSISSTGALKKLKTFFETKGRLPVVLVIDELDQILDKKQAILYDLLEWSSNPSSMLSLIAIFNTMSLPENGLVMRNVSRIGFVRCIFPPYTYDQLQTIIKSSLAACKSDKIKDDAIVLLSKKVAAVSGDARRALELAKRAIEIVETGQVSGVQAVGGAFKEIFSSIKVDSMINCTILEQSILKTLTDELELAGSEETTLITVFDNLCTSAAFDGHTWTKFQFMSAVTRLSMMKLLNVDHSSSIHNRVSLNVTFQDVKFGVGLASKVS